LLSPLRCYRDSVRTCKAVPYRCDTIWASASEPDIIEWSVTPNPANDVLEVSVSASIPQDFTMALYHLTTGRLESVFRLPASGRQTLDVKKVPPGVYLLAVLQEGQVIARQKLVIQH